MKHSKRILSLTLALIIMMSAISSQVTFAATTLSKPSVTVTSLDSGFKVSYPAVKGAKGYRIYYTTDADFKKYIKTKDLTKTSVSITGLKAYKRYYVRVRAYKTYKSGKKTKRTYSKYSSKKSVMTNVRSTYIKSLVAGEASLTVKVNAVPSVTGYQVRYADNAAFDNYRTITTTAPSVVIKKLGSSTGDPAKYYVRVRSYAVNNGKKYYSDWSSVKSTKTLPVTYPAAPYVESATSAVDGDTASITLNMFVYDVNTSAYQVCLALNNSFTADAVTTGIIYDSSVTISDLEQNTDYYYMIRSVRNLDGRIYYGEWTTPSCNMIRSANSKSNDYPSNLYAKMSVRNQRCTVYWDEVYSAADTVEYQVDYSTTSGFSDQSTSRAIVDEPKLSFATKYDFTYYVRVRSVIDTAGEKVYSDWCPTVVVNVADPLDTGSYDMTTPDDYDYVIIGNKIRLDSYIGDKTNIIVPSTMAVDGVEYSVALFKTFRNNTVVQNVFLDNPIPDTYSQMFLNATSLVSVDGSFSGVDTVTNGWQMFYNCSSLVNFRMDMTEWKDLDYAAEMFFGCSSLSGTLEFPSMVKNYTWVIYNCHNLDEIIFNSTTMTRPDNGVESFYTVLPGNALKRHITVRVPTNSQIYSIFRYCKSRIRSSDYVSLRTFGDTDRVSVIACPGDSISDVTQGHPDKLSRLYNGSHHVLNYGCSGDVTSKIAYRTGTYKMYTSAFTIPASADESVNFSITGENNYVLPTTFPIVTIAGVEGRITCTDSGYSFKRIKSGAEVSVPADTMIITSMDIATLTKDDVLVIHAGTNDLQTFDNAITNPDRIAFVISEIKDMIAYAGTDKYVVCGITTADRYNESNSLLYEQMMQDAFGEHYVDLRHYYFDNAYTIIGSTPSSEAQAQMDIGQVPSEFKIDNLHPSDQGGLITAHAIADKIEELNY